MKLVSLTVENFRSISAARRIPITQLTTLIGPNNEGKSNILRALAIGMNALLQVREAARVSRVYSYSPRHTSGERHLFNPDSDLPLRASSSSKEPVSRITLEFELSDGEVDEFYDAIGSQLNGTLPVAFSFSRTTGEVSIAKQGRGQKVLNAKAAQIARFVADRIDIQYIPAVRTAAAARRIVTDLVGEELKQIENDPLFVKALTDIAALQQPVLDQLSESLAETMKSFIPKLKGVKLTIDDRERQSALRGACNIYVDDGVETSLAYMGDGVQSLAALAIMRHASTPDRSNREVIVALEEPESHLHPAAIRELRGVLSELATQGQVVITTHNPLFANRVDASSNIIVQESKAFPATSIADVRKALGVRVDDNLTSAELVLLVEGDEDRLSLRTLLTQGSTVLRKALESGRLSIDVLGGASKLPYRARLHSDSLCTIHAFLDSDKEGERAFEAARSEGIIRDSDVNFSVCGGKRESELEDLYSEQLYEDILLKETGLPLVKQGPDKERKWSDRVSNLLKRAGRPNDQFLLNSIKMQVAREVVRRGWGALSGSKEGPIKSLIQSLESKLTG